MIDKQKLDYLSKPQAEPEFEGEPESPSGWDGLSAKELVKIRDEVMAALKKKIPVSLLDLNLEEELLLQFATVRALQSDVVDDIETPANQRAQVANAVGSSLKQIVDLQASVYTVERFKRIEANLIRWLVSLPEETARALLEEYSATVRSMQGLK